MTIVHVLEDFSMLSGGVRTVVKNLHDRLNRNGQQSIIISPNHEEFDEGIVTFKIKRNIPWCYSKDFKKKLNKIHIELNIDVIHIHGVWMFPQYYASRFAIRNDIPFIVSFHGMYEPWLWENGYIKKVIYSNLFTNNLFKKATYIHSITPNETKDLKLRFSNASVYEIPNLIPYNDRNIPENYSVSKSNYILFLGRLDPKKGIDLLIEAFSKIDINDNLRLIIAGPLNEYHKDLVKIVKSLSLEHKVEFAGLVKGAQKEELLQRALIFVSPSHSEVIGMVNLEAALSSTVVITTYQTGLSHAWQDNGGYLINPEVGEIKTAIQKVLSLNAYSRVKRQEQLKQYVIKNYSWEKRYKDWEMLYKKARD